MKNINFLILIVETKILLNFLIFFSQSFWKELVVTNIGNTICRTDDCSTTWAGENWLDIRALTQLEKIMGWRLDLAVKKGCDG